MVTRPPTSHARGQVGGVVEEVLARDDRQWLDGRPVASGGDGGLQASQGRRSVDGAASECFVRSHKSADSGLPTVADLVAEAGLASNFDDTSAAPAGPRSGRVPPRPLLPRHAAAACGLALLRGDILSKNSW